MKTKKKNILLGVCGGIAVYKSCSLVRLFQEKGCLVKVVMTPSAGQFIRPLLFRELSGNCVYWEMFSAEKENNRHIKLADWADLAVIAPLSANTLSKLAVGICDNLLTTVVCALGPKLPLLLVPAMNQNMWQNPVISQNLARLKKIKNYRVMAPARGKLACGKSGQGRMPEPEKICRQALQLLV